MARWDLSGDVVITINLASVQMIDFFVALGSNMSVTGTSVLTIYSEVNATGDIVYEGSPDIGGYIPAGIWRAGIDGWGAKEQTFGLGRLKGLIDIEVPWFSATWTISDSANPDGYIELRTLMMGHTYELETGYDFGSQIKIISGEEDETESGYILPGGVVDEAKELSIAFNKLNAADRIMLSLLQKRHGTSPWYVMARPWEEGLMREQYEFAAMMSNDGFSVVKHLKHSSKLIFKEV